MFSSEIMLGFLAILSGLLSVFKVRTDAKSARQAHHAALEKEREERDREREQQFQSKLDEFSAYMRGRVESADREINVYKLRVDQMTSDVMVQLERRAAAESALDERKQFIAIQKDALDGAIAKAVELAETATREQILKEQAEQENGSLKERIKTLELEQAALKAEIASLQTRVTVLETHNQELADENMQLKSQIPEHEQVGPPEEIRINKEM